MVAIVMEPVPPENPTLDDVGFTVSTPPDWFAVNVTAAPLLGVTVTVAVRPIAEGFANAL
jgi:hypothetical protein